MCGRPETLAVGKRRRNPKPAVAMSTLQCSGELQREQGIEFDPE
jgi:hypothetical protein